MSAINIAHQCEQEEEQIMRGIDRKVAYYVEDDGITFIISTIQRYDMVFYRILDATGIVVRYIDENGSQFGSINDLVKEMNQRCHSLTTEQQQFTERLDGTIQVDVNTRFIEFKCPQRASLRVRVFRDIDDDGSLLAYYVGNGETRWETIDILVNELTARFQTARDSFH